jgi:hypothetical protein
MIRSVLCTALLMLTPVTAPAQPRPLPPERIPPEAILETIRSAYDKKPTADEVKVTLYKAGHAPRLPSDTLASDTFVVRIDPGPPGSTVPVRLFLDFGALRVLVGGGKLTAVNPAVPGRYYQTKLAGPLTPQSLNKVLPPTPIPELALACADPASLASFTPYTPGVTWTAATIDPSARSATMTGASSVGPIVLGANPTTGRLTKVVATIKGARGGDTTLDLAITPTDAGSPASWTISIEGRQRVNSLAELRSPPPSSAHISARQPLPDFTLQRTDSTAWSLHRALSEPPAIPMAFILYRANPAERLGPASRDARAAAAVVRAVQFGQTSPGEPPATPRDLKLAAALVMDLGQFNRAALDEEQRLWQFEAAGRSPDAQPVPAPELLWANSAPQSIDRFDGAAGAVLLLIAADRTLLRVFPLDGRAAEPASLAADLRQAVAAPPTP